MSRASAPPGRANRAAWLMVGLGLATNTAGCGSAAHSLGRGAAEGAASAISRQLGAAERLKKVAGPLRQGLLGGLMGQLSEREHLEQIAKIGAALGAGAMAGAADQATGVSMLPPTSPTEGALDVFYGEAAGWRSGPKDTPIEVIAGQGTGAFSRRMAVELGSHGDGPLGRSLAATTEELSASVARGAHREIGELFPGCRGADSNGCLERTVERLARASSAGAVEGLRGSFGPWPLVLVFGSGAVSALAVAWAWSVERERRASRAARRAP